MRLFMAASTMMKRVPSLGTPSVVGAPPLSFYRVIVSDALFCERFDELIHALTDERGVIDPEGRRKGFGERGVVNHVVLCRSGRRLQAFKGRVAKLEIVNGVYEYTMISGQFEQARPGESLQQSEVGQIDAALQRFQDTLEGNQ